MRARATCSHIISPGAARRAGRVGVRARRDGPVSGRSLRRRARTARDCSSVSVVAYAREAGRLRIVPAARRCSGEVVGRTRIRHDVFGCSNGARSIDVVARVERGGASGSLKVNLALGELPNFRAVPAPAQPHHRATIMWRRDRLQQPTTTRCAAPRVTPMLECFLQTPTEPSLAPPGKHILSIFAQYFPYDRADGWSAPIATRPPTIVAILAAYAPNLPAAVEHRQVLAPPDLEALLGLTGGHIFHGEFLPARSTSSGLQRVRRCRTSISVVRARTPAGA